MEALNHLKSIPQWVAHDVEKVPFGPDGQPASSTDPSTWMTFEQARSLQRFMRLAGVGFVMSKDDDLVGIDLDKAIDSDGRVKPWAEDIVLQLGSYTEISPSGTGLHIWVRGQLPAGGRQKKVEDGRLEVYEKARYFTVTGRHLHGSPTTISEWGRTIGEWYWAHFEAPVHPPAPDPFEVDQDLDREIVEALEFVDAHDYHVWVAVGLAIKSHFGDAGFEIWRSWSATASNYGGDDRTFRKYRSFGRKGGITYRTIFHFAMEGGYEPPARYLSAEEIFPGIEAFCRALVAEEGPWEPDEPEEVWEPSEAPPVPEEVWAFDASDLRERKAQREYLIGPRLAGHGDVIVMAGPPKSMKSFVTLDMLAHFACGEQWHGLVPARPLRSLLLNCELHIDAVAERMQLLGKSPPPGSLFITDRIRHGLSKGMVERMKAHVDAHGPFDLLVIDPIANLFTEDNENDNRAMMVFLSHLTQVRKITMSDDAILWLVHHSRKAEIREIEADPFNSFRGASALRGFYDTGIAVWRQKGGTIGMGFELRNGEGLDRMSFGFAQGIFDRAIVEESTSKSDLDIIESVMCSSAFATKKALFEACHQQEVVIRGKSMAQSDSTWKRRIEACISSGKIEVSKHGLEWVAA